MTVKNTLLIFFLIVFTSSTHALPAERVPALQSLLQGNSEEWTYFSNNLRELPILNGWDGAQSIRRALRNFESNLNVEVGFILDRPPEATEEELYLDFFNALSQIQKLQGLEYFSASRGHMRLLFKEAFRVPEKDNKRILPDPYYTSIPDGQEFVIFQEDLSFGQNYTSVQLEQDLVGISMSMENLTTMFYAILPLVDPGNLRMIVKISIFEENILFYGVSAVRTGSFFGIENSRQESFYHRLSALFTWFRDNLTIF